MPRRRLRISPGRPLPLGAHPDREGVNFALFSRHATEVVLHLFASPRDPHPAHTLILHPHRHRTGDIWHIHVAGIGSGQAYGFRVDGPYYPELGLRFNRHRLLSDPYGAALWGTSSWDFARAQGYDPKAPEKDLSFATDDNGPWAARTLVVDDDFDWEGDSRPRHSWSKTVIYETHIRGLTIHPSSAVRHPGTYLGVIEKIPYFKSLGVTALELLPVQEFNENELVRLNPLTGERLRNYWGYSPVAFFAPKEAYGGHPRPGGQVRAFKTMVKALHASDIEVILDVVFNHTAEGDALGPTLNLRGIENDIYYILEEDKRFYKNFSGCGNTVNCNHPIVRDLIMDCLRYWVVEMHVDGFRFDLASILGRDEKGAILPNPPLLQHIAEDPILRDVKLIAEAWDAGGAFQVGSFPGQRWSEWNSHYRDDVRRFWRGDQGMRGAFAWRLCGSADLYQHGGKAPINSINYVTCHDGFTLNDLVSYAVKHNEANGEGNRDGMDENYSANYGVEGEADDPAIQALRTRQIKNFIATLFLSRGVPMMLGGDEFRRTQKGNNNAYCQDNEISWYDWRLVKKHPDIFAFAQGMIRFRARHPVLSEERFYTDEEVTWFDPEGRYPDWHAPDNTLGFYIHRPPAGRALCLLFNAGTREITFALPQAPGGKGWRMAVNTAEKPPGDIPARQGHGVRIHRTLRLKDRALAVLTEIL